MRRDPQPAAIASETRTLQAIGMPLPSHNRPRCPSALIRRPSKRLTPATRQRAVGSLAPTAKRQASHG
jgi:hypothetical protein